jgi:two-component system, sensor histidine kinase and response regulator
MKILIADDDATTRVLLRGVLEKWGYAVFEAASGPEAWEHFQSPDAALLAIIDWMMPGISGPELCRRLKGAGRTRIPYVILLTSRADLEDLIQGLDSGADDFMVKPCQNEELRARLNVGRRFILLQGQLREANDRLEQRVRHRTELIEGLLRQKEELLNYLSHDLKTPLTPLISLLPVLRASESDPERREMLDLALEGARSIQAMVARVLELCHVGGRSRPVIQGGIELRDLVNAAVDQCRQIRQWEGRTVQTDVPEGIRVRADAVQVRQVLEQLLDNAVRFTRPGGKIRVSAGPSQGLATVEVTDNGIGLEVEQKARLFEPFYKADKSRHDRTAAGLGLTIAKTIVERHGGEIWAESAGLQRGSTIYFTLPTAEGRSPGKDSV